MKVQDFKKAAKERGREILKVKNTKSGVYVTFAASIDPNTISIPQTRFFRHNYNRFATYDDIIREWSC